MSLCKDCVKGVRHEGTPEGTWEKINGVDSYVATPSVDYPKEKVLLYLPDGLGAQFVNNQLLADDFARNGFKTVIPDILNGDPISVEALDDPAFDWRPWIIKHTPEKTRPTLDKAIAGLKAQGVTEFAATGYCIGGRYVFDLAFDHVVQVAVVAHPSFLQSPADLEKYATTADAPLLINSCTYDDQFPLAAQAQADTILGDGKFVPGYQRIYWEGCTHGFAIKGDLTDPQVKAGKEGAFKSTVEWLIKYM